MVTDRISVRNLVEFLLRAGDIDNRTGTRQDAEAMQLGSRMHRKIQAGMGADYHAEVPLKHLVPCNEFEILVEGRADGIIEGGLAPDGTEVTVTVDEIKGIFTDPEHMKEPVPVHLAQAMCYAHFYLCDHECDGSGQERKACVRMTYVNLETEEIRYFHHVYTETELADWFDALVSRYIPWASFRYHWRQERNASARMVTFPFEYREGQKDVAASVYRTIDRGRQLFLMAPTGVGKTIATVFPGVKAVGEEKAETIFYLTARTTARTVAQKAFAALQDEGLRYKVLTLTAKDKICFLEERKCNPVDCPYACGHYDRVNDAVYDLLCNEDSCDRQIIERYAKLYRVCPFEMALDLSLWVDAVICDYNYLFDPNAHLRRFFAEGVKGSYLFLIDEAHNLVDRGREMYSASLRKEDFLELRRMVLPYDGKLAAKLMHCNKVLLSYKRECEGEYMILESISGLIMPLLGVMGALEDFLDDDPPEEVREPVLNFYFEVRDFVNIYELADDHYVIYALLSDSGFSVKLFCVNPARNLNAYLEKGVASVFFSATFLPIAYYKSLLSVDEDPYAIYARSPFPEENRYVAIGTGVSSRYTMRGPDMYQSYAEYILEGIGKRDGNYMAFFPSYRMLQDVLEAFRGIVDDGTESLNGMIPEDHEGFELLVQTPDMNEEAKEQFLDRFELPPESGSRIGFCVMGGAFAEGIDLTEDSLIGAFIVGTGIPQISCEREILKNYFDENGKNGFCYAYLYAGMNRVLQAAGRVIRTESDRGIVMLLDERFTRREYRELFPREWGNVETVSSGKLSDALDVFWNGTETGAEDGQL